MFDGLAVKDIEKPFEVTENVLSNKINKSSETIQVDDESKLPKTNEVNGVHIVVSGEKTFPSANGVAQVGA